MKSPATVKTYLRYAGIIFMLVFLSVVYGYRSSQPLSKKENSSTQSASSISKAPAKKMALGASCCKASFSRTKMLAGKTAHSTISPAGKQ